MLSDDYTRQQSTSHLVILEFCWLQFVTPLSVSQMLRCSCPVFTLNYFWVRSRILPKSPYPDSQTQGQCSVWVGVKLVSGKGPSPGKPWLLECWNHMAFLILPTRIIFRSKVKVMLLTYYSQQTFTGKDCLVESSNMCSCRWSVCPQDSVLCGKQTHALYGRLMCSAPKVASCPGTC